MIARALALAALGAAAAATACASAPVFQPSGPMRVLVLNMHAGKDAAGQSNLDGIAALIKNKQADVVLLQEVDRGTNRSGHEDQIARLASAVEYDFAFAPSLLDYDGGQYGIAVLSRHAIGFRMTKPLPVRPEQTRAGGSHEPRVGLLALTTVGNRRLGVMNTHLDPADQDARIQEITAFLRMIRDQQAVGEPFVAGGDFNATPENPMFDSLRSAGLRDAWTECGSGDGLTYPADNPVKRIDYLWLSAELQCTSAEVVDTRVSDHRPLLVTVR
jgi:endonuclease/exonuclease/phosphatase family metal-dependent hydrolase